jgi:gluconolactonase
MAELEIVAEGLRFPEGPVAMPDGSVILVEIEAGRVTRVRPDGSKETVAEPGNGPNGLALGPDGMLYCVNNGGFSWLETPELLRPDLTAADYPGTGRVDRIDIATGRVETLYQSGDNGVIIRGPNDIVFDAHGGFYFSDFGKMRERSRDTTGLFYGKADGSLVAEVAHPMDGPNGVGLSPDGRTLYAAETFSTRLWAFDVEAPGRLGPARHLYRPGGFTYFDSLAVEAEGNICVATLGEGGISVVSPEGALVEFVAVPDFFTTNIAFGGPDMRTAWITLSGSGRLAKMRWPRPGLKLEGQIC